MIDAEKLREIYASMLKLRSFRKQAQVRGARRRSQLLFTEACEVGCTIDLQPQDTIAVSPQQNFVIAMRGLQPVAAHGNQPQSSERTISLNILTHRDTAERLMLATGIAFAHWLQKDHSVVVVFADKDPVAANDTSLQFAFEHRLPILFVQHAVPAGARKRSRSKKTFQLPVIPVDENDAIAVYRVAYEALDKARRGVGPTVIEAIGSGTSERSRSNGQQHHDALEYMEWYLRRRSLWSDDLKRPPASL